MMAQNAETFNSKSINMKTLINNILTIAGFIMIVGIPYSVYSGQFLFFVMGCFGFALFMRGLFMDMPESK